MPQMCLKKKKEKKKKKFKKEKKKNGEKNIRMNIYVIWAWKRILKKAYQMWKPWRKRLDDWNI